MQRFFKLQAPQYADDFEHELVNPVWSRSPYNIPGIICPMCGPMAFDQKLRITLPDTRLLGEFEGIRHIRISDWVQQRPRWAQLLGLNPNRITPGASLGPPHGLLKGMPTADFIYPSMDVWVRTRLMEALRLSHCTGVEFAKSVLISASASDESFCDGVQVNYKAVDPANMPEYWELNVTGSAWRVGYDENRIRQCEICGRKSFPDPDFLKVDESRWDGSEFFNVDCNPYIILVTDRVCRILKDINASNYICEQVNV